MNKRSLRLHELDRQDLAILDILQTDATTTQRIIGEKVNLSAAAVQRRISRMAAGGVIEGYSARLNPASLGQPITVLVEVSVENERRDQLNDLKSIFASTPEIQQCYYVTGETDFVLVISISSMSAYEALTDRIFFGNANIKHFQSHVVMNRVKSTLAIVIPEYDQDR